MAAGLAGQSMRTWGAAAGVIVLALSGLFGGLDQAGTPPAKPGTEIVSPTWKVTIHSARVIASHPRLSKTDNQWIGISARIEVVVDKSLSSSLNKVPPIGAPLRLTGVPGIANESKQYGLTFTYADSVLLKRDDALIRVLHPGLPEEVEFFWQQKPGTAVPAQLTVRVIAMVWRKDSITNYEDWKEDDSKTVEVVVPLSDQRAATKAVTS